MERVRYSIFSIIEKCLDKDNLDLAQFLLSIPLILFVISIPILGVSFINLFVLFVTTIMAVFFIYIIKEETIEGKSFKESNENIFVDADIKTNELALINEKFNEKVLFLNKLIKEQIKKDINELILKYLLLCEQEDLVFEFNKEYVRLIQEQKLLIEKNINDTISKLIKKTINLDIDKNIENIDNNLNLYLNLMK